MPLKGKPKKTAKKVAAPKKKTAPTKRKRSILSKTAAKKPTRKRSKVVLGVEAKQEQLIEQNKYFPVPIMQNNHEPKTFEPPLTYDENKIVLMVRDPYWLFTYWEITQSKIDEIKNELGERFHASVLILRVYDTANWNFFDLNVHSWTGNWYINVGRPNTAYCIDIGFLTPDGYFVCAARSNTVITPRDNMSEVIDEEWMVPDWEMMYALSGGFGRGKGSMEIKEMIEKRQWQASSSWISSYGSPDRRNK